LSRKSKCGRILKMDINILDKNSIKIKIKKVNFVIDPGSSISKTNADAIIAFDASAIDSTRVTDYRVIIKGPGEYEVGGVKVVGVKDGESLAYSLIAQETSIIIGKASSLGKMLDKVSEHGIAVLDIDSKLDPSIITAIEPRYLVLYGEKVKEELSSLSKELLEKKTESSQKISLNEEKMPEEMELFVLG
jgi:hypothetical protein